MGQAMKFIVVFGLAVLCVLIFSGETSGSGTEIWSAIVAVATSRVTLEFIAAAALGLCYFLWFIQPLERIAKESAKMIADKLDTVEKIAEALRDIDLQVGNIAESLDKCK